MRYNAGMESLIDKTAVLLGCMTALVIMQPDVASIAVLLVALSLTAACERVGEGVSLGISCAYLAAAMAFPLLLVGLPLLAYECGRSRFRWAQLAWVAPLLAAALRVPVEPLIASAIICCMAFVLAWRTSTLLSERRQYRVLRDSVREQALVLEQRNRALHRELEEAQGAPATSAPDAYPSLVFANLTERELEIAMHVAEGLDNKEIASIVYASEGTVRNHISSILQKTGLHNRTQIAIAYLQR